MAWATRFNPDYDSRATPRYDTWDLRTDAGEQRVATIYLFFRYKNQGVVPPAAPRELVLVLLRWLDANAADTALHEQRSATARAHSKCCERQRARLSLHAGSCGHASSCHAATRIACTAHAGSGTSSSVGSSCECREGPRGGEAPSVLGAVRAWGGGVSELICRVPCHYGLDE